MAERKRSSDGRRETEELTDTGTGAGSVGRSGGDRARRLSTAEELAEHFGDPSTHARLTKSDDRGERAGHGTTPLHAPTARAGEGRRSVLSHGTWVLVANGEKALFLENKGDAEMPDLAVIEDRTQDNPPTREQAANRRGRAVDTGPGQRSAMEDTDWHALGKERFAGALGETLYERAHAGAFQRLIVVAPPRVLGTLRDAMHSEVRERLVAEVAKDLTNLPVGDIERHLVAALLEE